MVDQHAPKVAESFLSHRLWESVVVEGVHGHVHVHDAVLDHVLDHDVGVSEVSDSVDFHVLDLAANSDDLHHCLSGSGDSKAFHLSDLDRCAQETWYDWGRMWHRSNSATFLHTTHIWA